MSVYQYSAKDKKGKPVSGVIEAGSEQEAAAALYAKELIVLAISQAKSSERSAAGKDKKVKPEELVIFSRQLATMIDAGIPLVNSLGILAEQIENKSFKEIVSAVNRDIQAGMSFCDALNKHAAVFSELFINMAAAGEASGQLNEVLDRLATYLEKSASLARKIRSSLIYPAVVVTMAVLITTALLVWVVPTFKGIFDMLGGKLPLPTQILIAVSEFLRRFFPALAVILIAAGFLFKKYISTENGRYKFDRFKLAAPVLGELLRKVAVAKFSRTFSTLSRSGVSVLSALEIVGKTAGNKVIEEAVRNASKSVREGEPISRPLAKSGVFPVMVCRMVGVGEQTGQLEKMLSKIADFYDEQVDAATSALTSMIEPLVIAFMGVVIGSIVIALFLPIFKITELLGR
jgi:type IV pilus assembly protein PilC